MTKRNPPKIKFGGADTRVGEKKPTEKASPKSKGTAPEERKITPTIIGYIQFDPNQPRKLPTDPALLAAALEDITSTLEADADGNPLEGKGINDPVTVRRAPPGAPGPEPLMLLKGERRVRSALAKGLKWIDAIEVEIAEEDVLAAQLLEFEATRPLTPLERADAIAKLAAPPAGKRRGPTAEDIAYRLGTKPAEVRRALALARLCPEARAALELGTGDPKGIGVGVALRLATIDDPEEQATATGHVLGMDLRAARSHIDGFHLALFPDRCGFDPKDASLPGGACEACPHNTKSQRTLGLLDGADAEAGKCTKKSCYDGKKAEAWKRKKAAAEAAGAKVATPEQAKELYPQSWDTTPDRDDLLDLDKPAEINFEPVDGEKTWREVLGAEAKPSLLAQDPKGQGHELLTMKEAAERLALSGKTELAEKLRKEAEGLEDSEEETGSPPSAPSYDPLQRREARLAAGDQALRVIFAEVESADPASVWRWLAATIARQEAYYSDDNALVGYANRRGIDVEEGDAPRREGPALAALLAWLERPESNLDDARALAVELVIYREGPVDGEGAWADGCKFAGVDFKALLERHLGEEPADKLTEPPSGAAKVDESDPSSQSSGPASGTCRICACTENKPCDVDGPCCWVDSAETLCSACAGVMQEIEDQVDEHDGLTRPALWAALDRGEGPGRGDARDEGALADLLSTGHVIERDGELWAKGKEIAPRSSAPATKIEEPPVIEGPGAWEEMGEEIRTAAREKVLAATSDAWRTEEEIAFTTGLAPLVIKLVLERALVAGEIGRAGDEWCSKPPSEEPADRPATKPAPLAKGDRVRCVADGHLKGRLGTVDKLCGPPFVDRFYVDFDLVGRERTRKHLQLGPADVEKVEGATAPSELSPPTPADVLRSLVEVGPATQAELGKRFPGVALADLGTLTAKLSTRGEAVMVKSSRQWKPTAEGIEAVKKSGAVETPEGRAAKVRLHILSLLGTPRTKLEVINASPGYAAHELHDAWELLAGEKRIVEVTKAGQWAIPLPVPHTELTLDERIRRQILLLCKTPKAPRMIVAGCRDFPVADVDRVFGELKDLDKPKASRRLKGLPGGKWQAMT